MLFENFKHDLLPKCKRPRCHLRVNSKNVVGQVTAKITALINWGERIWEADTAFIVLHQERNAAILAAVPYHESESQ